MKKRPVDPRRLRRREVDCSVLFPLCDLLAVALEELLASLLVGAARRAEQMDQPIERQERAEDDEEPARHVGEESLLGAVVDEEHAAAETDEAGHPLVPERP